jgi:hypothetical protein
VAPQQRLYFPGCYLKEEGNETVVLSLERSEMQSNVQGVKERIWRNGVDIDLP